MRARDSDPLSLIRMIISNGAMISEETVSARRRMMVSPLVVGSIEVLMMVVMVRGIPTLVLDSVSIPYDLR